MSPDDYVTMFYLRLLLLLTSPTVISIMRSLVYVAITLLVCSVAQGAQGKDDKKNVGKEAPKKETPKKEAPKKETPKKDPPASKKSIDIGAVQFGGEGVSESMVLDFNERQIININIPTTGDATKFEQAAVRFTHKETTAEVWFPLIVKSGSMKIDIDLPRHAEESFHNVAGIYSVAVLISDEHLTKNVQKDVVQVNLNLTPSPLWKQKQEFAETKDWKRRVPQAWDMKPNEERGSATVCFYFLYCYLFISMLELNNKNNKQMSLFFSGLLGFPVLVLLYLLFLAGANIKGLVDNPVVCF